jgi:hypothetical protein
LALSAGPASARTAAETDRGCGVDSTNVAVLPGDGVERRNLRFETDGIALGTVRAA